MSQAQSTPLFEPHTPIPTPIVYARQETPHMNSRKEMVNTSHQYLFALVSIGLATSSVILWYEISSPRISGSLIAASFCIFLNYGIKKVYACSFFSSLC